MNLDPNYIKSKIILMINANYTLSEIRIFFMELKEKGITKESVYQLLEDIRNNNSTDNNEDIVLELMDIASNFCSMPLRVWE